VSRYNSFRLNLQGAIPEWVPAYENGQIIKVRVHVRGKRRLVEYGAFGTMIELLRSERDISRLLALIRGTPMKHGETLYTRDSEQLLLQALEIMVNEGWVDAKHDPKRSLLVLGSPYEGRYIHTNVELNRKIAGREEGPEDLSSDEAPQAG